MGTHLRALSESYLMNTNMTGFEIALALEVLIESVSTGYNKCCIFPYYLKEGILLSRNYTLKSKV